MTNAAQALRQAILTRLAADGPLKALLGGSRIVDDPPRAPMPPSVTLGEWLVRDASASLTWASEHQLAITIWTDAGSAAQANAIADAVIACLESMPPALDGHRLSNLAALTTEVRREREGRLTRALIRIRALTEAL